MFREDIVWLILPTLIALFQVKIIWSNLPDDDRNLELKGSYTESDILKFVYLENIVYLILIIQLLTPVLVIKLPLDINLLLLRIIGLFLIFIGFFISFLALKKLKNNWSPMYYYQIKKNHLLITNGVYKLIRHPLYFSVLLELIGFELTALSYLFIPFAIIGFIIFNNHIKKEELLLIKKFKKQYLIYIKNTKKIIPYLY